LIAEYIEDVLLEETIATWSWIIPRNRDDAHAGQLRLHCSCGEETTSQSDARLIEEYTLGEDEPFTRVYLKEIATIL